MHVLESDVERLNQGKKHPAENKIHDLTNEKMVRNVLRLSYCLYNVLYLLYCMCTSVHACKVGPDGGFGGWYTAHLKKIVW